MIKKILLLVLIVGIAAAIFVLIRQPFDSSTKPVLESISPSPTQPQVQRISGEILNIVQENGVITINTTDNNKVYIATLPETSIHSKTSKNVPTNYLKRGFTISAEGTYKEDDTFFPSSIEVEKEPNIIVYSPLPEQVVGNEFEVIGIGRVFENVLSLRLKNEQSGKVYSEDTATVRSKDTGAYGEFAYRYYIDELVKSVPSGERIVLEVFQVSARDGSETDMVRIPLIIEKDSEENLKVQVFFSNTKLGDPNSCESVYPVVRTIPNVKSVARATLESLFEGPSYEEKTKGYITNINSDVKVQKIVIEDGVAKVDLSKDFQENLAGSCKVTAIREQINQTLLQFDTISSVEITVDGKKDVLEP